MNMRKVGVPPREIFLGAYPPEEWLCVVEALKHYEARTQQYRESGETTEDKATQAGYIPNVLPTG